MFPYKSAQRRLLECYAAVSQVDGDSLKGKAALNAELHEKLAELQRLKDFQAAAVKQQSQSAHSQGPAAERQPRPACIVH